MSSTRTYKAGTATNENLKSLHVSNEVKLKFRFRRFLKVLFQKLQGRPPLKYSSVGNAIAYRPISWSLNLRQPSYILTLLLKSFIR